MTQMNTQQPTEPTRDGRGKLSALLLGIMTVVAVLWMLVNQMVPEQAQGTAQQASMLCDALLMALMVWQFPRTRVTELRAVVLNVCWLFLTRVVMGCLLWQSTGSFYVSVLMLAALSVPMILGQRARGILFDFVTAAVGALTTLWGLLGIVAYFGGDATAVAQQWITFNDGALRCFGFDSGLSASFFVVGLGLMLTQLCRKKNLLWRIWAVLYVPVSLMILMLVRSVSGTLAAAICIGVALGVAVQSLLKKAKPAVKGLLSLLVAVLIGVLCYLGLTIGTQALVNSPAAVTPQEEETTAPDEAAEPAPTEADETLTAAAEDTDAAPTEPAEAAAPTAASEQTSTPTPAHAPAAVTEADAPTQGADITETADPTQGADITESAAPTEQDEDASANPPVLTVTIPTEDTTTPTEDATDPAEESSAEQPAAALSANGVLAAIQERPLTLLIGQDEGATEEPRYVSNLLLHQLLTAGIPGMVIYLLFLISLLFRMVKTWVSEQVPVALKCLSGLLLGLLAYGMLEPMLSSRLLFASFLFCLLSGYLVQTCEECSITAPKGPAPKALRRRSYNPQRLTGLEDAVEEPEYEEQETPEEEPAPMEESEPPVEEERAVVHVPRWMLEKTPVLAPDDLARVVQREEPEGYDEEQDESTEPEEPAAPAEPEETPAPAESDTAQRKRAAHHRAKRPTTMRVRPNQSRDGKKTGRKR